MKKFTNMDELVSAVLFEWSLLVKHGGSVWNTKSSTDMYHLQEAMEKVGIPYGAAKEWIESLVKEEDDEDEEKVTAGQEEKPEAPQAKVKKPEDDKEDVITRARKGDVAAELKVKELVKRKREKEDEEEQERDTEEREKKVRS